MSARRSPWVRVADELAVALALARVFGPREHIAVGVEPAPALVLVNVVIHVAQVVALIAPAAQAARATAWKV